LGGEENFQEKTKTQRNQKKKKKKKRTKRHQKKEEEDNENNDDVEEPLQVDIEYIQEEIVYDDKNPFYRQFAKIFEAFKIIDEKTAKKAEEEESKKKELQRSLELKKVPKFAEEEDLEDKKDNADDDKPKVSKRKLKQLTRLSVADLKQCVARPDVVEMHDVTARDPKLLVLLKATRNSVPVPRHWCAKRKYLQVYLIIFNRKEKKVLILRCSTSGKTWNRETTFQFARLHQKDWYHGNASCITRKGRVKNT
jgi:splicing factor 3B subunit 2